MYNKRTYTIISLGMNKKILLSTKVGMKKINFLCGRGVVSSV